MPPCCRRMWSGELTPSSVAQELRTVAPSLASMAKYFNTFLSTAAESLQPAQTKQNAGSSVHAVLRSTAERAPSATTSLRSASPACVQSRHCNASGMHRGRSDFAFFCRRPAWLAQCVSALAGHRPPVPPVSHLLPAWRPCGAHLLPPDCRLAPDRSAEFPEAPAPLPTGSARSPRSRPLSHDATRSRAQCPRAFRTIPRRASRAPQPDAPT